MIKTLKGRVPALAVTFLGFSLFVTAQTACAKVKQPEQPVPESLSIFDASEGRLLSVEPVVRTAEEWRQLLTPEQYRVAREHGTEQAWTGEYDKHTEKGIYKCVGCGTDLFASDTKYDSGTGWPSFWEPVHEANVGTTLDTSFFMRRIEVHCARCRSHLGHIFNDGPPPTGKRFCINSAALKFEGAG